MEKKLLAEEPEEKIIARSRKMALIVCLSVLLSNHYWQSFAFAARWCKGKVKLALEQNKNAHSREQRYNSTLSLTLALYWGGWSYPRPSIHREWPGTHWVAARPVCTGREKLASLTAFDSWTLKGRDSSVALSTELSRPTQCRYS